MSEHDADPYASFAGQFSGHPEPGSVTRRGNPRPIGFDPALAAPYGRDEYPTDDPFTRLQAAIKEKHRRRVRERCMLMALIATMSAVAGIAIHSYFNL